MKRLLLAAGLLYSVWTLAETVPPQTDEVRTLTHTRRLAEVVREGRWPELLTLGAPHPPGLPLSLLPLFWLGGGEIRFLRLVAVLYLLLGVWSLARLGRRSGQPRTGLLAACLFALAPLWAGPGRRLLMEGPLAAVLALVLFLGHRTEGLRRPGAAFLLGLSVAWAFLLKWTALAFLWLPGLWLFCAWLRHRSLLPLGMLLLGTAPAWPWYLASIPRIAAFYAANQIPRPYPTAWQPFADPTAPEALAFYVFGLEDLLGVVPLGCALAALRLRAARAHPAWALLLGALVALSPLRAKDVRHLLPATPALAWLGAAGAPGGLWPRGLLLLGAALAGLFPAAGAGPRRPLAWTPHPHLVLTLLPAAPPPEEDPYGPLLADLSRFAHAAGRPLRVLVLPNLEGLHAAGLWWYAQTERLRLSIHDARAEPHLPRLLEEADCILTVTFPPPTPPLSPPYPPRVALAAWLQGLTGWGPPPALQEAATYRVAGLEAVLYRRRGPLPLWALREALAAVRTGDPRLPWVDLALRGLRRRRPPPKRRVWAAPLPRWPRLDGRLQGDGVRCLLLGPPGTPFRLARSRRRVRLLLSAGPVALAGAEPVAAGRLDRQGRATLRLPHPGTARPVYLQALLGGRVTNWLALGR